MFSHHLSLADTFDLLAGSSAGSTVAAPQNMSKLIPAASYVAFSKKHSFHSKHLQIFWHFRPHTRIENFLPVTTFFWKGDEWNVLGRVCGNLILKVNCEAPKSEETHLAACKASGQKHVFPGLCINI